MMTFSSWLLFQTDERVLLQRAQARWPWSVPHLGEQNEQELAWLTERGDVVWQEFEIVRQPGMKMAK